MFPYDYIYKYHWYNLPIFRLAVMFRLNEDGSLGLIWFYGISTTVGHSMPNPFHTFIKFMIFKHILKITF